MVDKRNQGHPGNQFNRKAPPGEEGFTLGAVYISWEIRQALKKHLQPDEEPTKENIARIARQIIKERLEQEIEE